MQNFAQKYLEKIASGKQTLDASTLIYAHEKFIADKQKKQNGIFYTPTYIIKAKKTLVETHIFGIDIDKTKMA